MIDIDVEGNRRYGVIEAGSRAYKMLLRLRTLLITQRLSSADGSTPFLTADVVAREMGFKATVMDVEISHLVRIGILDPVYERPQATGHKEYDDINMLYPDTYWSRANYSYRRMLSSEQGFCLGKEALAAITEIKSGADIVRFAFP